MQSALSVLRRFPRSIHNRSLATTVNAPFHYQELFDLKHDVTTPYRKLTSDYVSVVDAGNNHKFLKVDPKGLELLSEEAFKDVSHLLRPGHLQSLSNILKDPEASPNDKFVALELLKNANIAI